MIIMIMETCFLYRSLMLDTKRIIYISHVLYNATLIEYTLQRLHSITMLCVYVM